MNTIPMQGNVIEIGQFAVTSGVMEVTDPCYSPGTDHLLEGVRCGTWVAETEISDGYNVSITVRHIDYQMEDCFVFESSDIGVDSGQAGFFDASRYVGSADSQFYDMVCDLTLNGDNAGVIEFGAVSSSGGGDGCYELQTIRRGNEVVAARIVFMAEESNEAEYHEDDDEEDDEVAEVEGGEPYRARTSRYRV